MGTLELLKAAAKRGPVVDLDDSESTAEIQRQDRKDASRAAYQKEELERLANQVGAVAAKRAEVIGEPLATEAQQRYFASLTNQVMASGVKEYEELAWKANEWHAHLFGKHGGIPRRLISQAIDRMKTHAAAVQQIKKLQLQAVPAKAAPAAEVEPGRYALRGEDGVVRFYRVKMSRQGRPYVMVQASDDLHLVNWFAGGRAVYDRIAEEPEVAARLYGQELGKCYKCGRTLTDETSRALGIGPDCRSKD